jgi:GT2 family glycosyltransferase
MKKAEGVSIIIAVWNQVAYTKICLDYLLRHTKDVSFEIVIVDNGSRSETKALIDSINPNVDVHYIRNDRNLGPIKAINQGIEAAKYRYSAVMHNDVIIFEDGWLARMVKVFEADPKIGIAGFAGRKEIYNNGAVNETSLKHNLQNEDLNEVMREEVAEVAVLDGLFFMMRQELLDKIKGLDETYGYMHCYDLDVSLKSIEAGFKNVVVNIEAMHVANGGMTRGQDEYKSIVKDDYGLLKKNCKILSEKWRHLLPFKVSA